MAKKAIVMGATSGIGMEVAKLLAAKGWQVGIAGRRIERLQALISQGGITCYQQIDVTSPDAPAQLLELIEKLGGMDLYFHSSGIGWQNNTLDIEKELKTVETNGLGFTRMVDTAFNWFATHHHCNPKARIACSEICEWADCAFTTVVVYQDATYLRICHQLFPMLGHICQGLLQLSRELNLVFLKLFQQCRRLLIEVV